MHITVIHCDVTTAQFRQQRVSVFWQRYISVDLPNGTVCATWIGIARASHGFSEARGRRAAYTDCTVGNSGSALSTAHALLKASISPRTIWVALKMSGTCPWTPRPCGTVYE